MNRNGLVILAVVLAIGMATAVNVRAAAFADCPTSYGTLVCDSGERYCNGCKTSISDNRTAPWDLNCVPCVWNCPSPNIACGAQCRIPTDPATPITTPHCATYDFCSGSCATCVSPYAYCEASHTCTYAVTTCSPGENFNPCSGVCEGNPYILASPSSAQSAYINITRYATLGEDLNMSSNKAIMSPGAGVTHLNFGNWGAGATGFNLDVYGNVTSTGIITSKTRVTTPEICLAGDCRAVWPVGGATGSGESMWASSTANLNNIYNKYLPGFVGIGSANPGYPLFVASANSTAVVAVDDASAGGNLWTGFRISRNTNEKWFVGIDSAAGVNSLLFRRSPAVGPRVNDMVISNAGIVGIGTENPNANTKLEVNGNASATQFCLGGSCISSWPSGGVGDNLGNHIATQDLNMNGKNINGLGNQLNSTNASNLYVNANESMQLRINTDGGTGTFGINNSANNPVVIVSDGGNVGIGSANPNYLLDFGQTYGVNAASANAKKIALYNNTNGTGFYGFGVFSGGIGFYTNKLSTETADMVLLSGGNVGIGTDSPGNNFVVQNNSASGADLIKLNQNNATKLWTGLRLDRLNLEKWFIGMGTTDETLLFRRTSASNDMAIAASGNVGIGTINPATTLDVNGSASAAQFCLPGVSPTGGCISQWPSAGAGDNLGNHLAVQDLNLGGFKINSVGSELNSSNAGGFYANASTSLQLRINSGGAGGTFGINNSANSRLVTVLDSGNVGIGAVSPLSKLTVAVASGNAEMRIGRNAVSGRDAIIRKNTDTAPYTLDILASAYTTGNNADIRFFNGDQASGQSMVIQYTGNIGIGASAPDESLVINRDRAVTNHDAQVKLLTVAGSNTAWSMYHVGASGGAVSQNSLVFWHNGANVMELTPSNGIIVSGNATATKFCLPGVSPTGGCISQWPSAGAGDNLGNHLAVQDLNLGGFKINSVGSELNSSNAGGFYANASTSLQLRINSGGAGGTFGINNSANSRLVTVLDSGNVGIGATNPDAKLQVAGQIKITGGNPGVGKVLTSDANGLAEWKEGGNQYIQNQIAVAQEDANFWISGSAKIEGGINNNINTTISRGNDNSSGDAYPGGNVDIASGGNVTHDEDWRGGDGGTVTLVAGGTGYNADKMGVDGTVNVGYRGNAKLNVKGTSYFNNNVGIGMEPTSYPVSIRSSAYSAPALTVLAGGGLGNGHLDFGYVNWLPAGTFDYARIQSYNNAGQPGILALNPLGDSTWNSGVVIGGDDISLEYTNDRKLLVEGMQTSNGVEAMLWNRAPLNSSSMDARSQWCMAVGDGNSLNGGSKSSCIGKRHGYDGTYGDLAYPMVVWNEGGPIAMMTDSKVPLIVSNEGGNNVGLGIFDIVGLSVPRFPLDVIADANDNIAVISVEDYHGSKLFTGYRIARSGSEKWFMGMDTTNGEEFRINQNGLATVFKIDQNQNAYVAQGLRLGDLNYGALGNPTARPGCNSGTNGTLWFTPGASGVKDKLEVCAKDASNTYGWRTLY